MAAMRQMCEDYRPHVTENVQGISLAGIIIPTTS